MKLLFINQSLGIGGAETFNKELLLWLQNHGVSVKTYVTNKKFQKILRENKISSGHIPFIVDVIGDWKGFLKGIVLLSLAFVYYSILIIKNRNADVILMSGFVEKILITPLAKILKIKVIWIEFAPLESIFIKFLGIPKFFYSIVRNLPNNIITPSKYTLCKLKKSLDFKNNLIVHIHCARDIDINNYSNIKTEEKCVCCVSRLEKGKGQDLLLKAWQRVEKEIPEAKLNIVGEGDFIKELKTSVINLNLKNVNFCGFVSDPLIEMAKSEIFVFPTVWPLEGFGLVALEAMALGKPVVCFNFGPIPEIVDKTTGILIEPRNTESLANSIIKLLNSQKLIKKMGDSGRRKYLDKFTFDIIGPKYIKTFKNG